MSSWGFYNLKNKHINSSLFNNEDLIVIPRDNIFIGLKGADDYYWVTYLLLGKLSPFSEFFFFLFIYLNVLTAHLRGLWQGTKLDKTKTKILNQTDSLVNKINKRKLTKQNRVIGQIINIQAWTKWQVFKAFQNARREGTILISGGMLLQRGRATKERSHKMYCSS